MTKFEYIALENCINDEPTEEEVLKQVGERSWTSFESRYSDNEYVVQEILEKHYFDWEVYDEDDGVYIAIRKKGEDDFEVYRATLFYSLDVNTKCIYVEDDFRGNIEEDEEGEEM